MIDIHTDHYLGMGIGIVKMMKDLEYQVKIFIFFPRSFQS